MPAPEQLNAYLEAKVAYEERWGSWAVRLTNWQRACAASMLVNVILAAGIVFVKTRPAYVPYVAMVDPKHNVLAVAYATPATGTTVEQVKADSLRQWIRDIRTVLTDWTADKTIIDNATAKTRVPSQARTVLVDYFTTHRVDELSKKGSVTVDIRSFLPQSSDTWLVDWVETSYDLSGGVTGVAAFRGQFRVSLHPHDKLDLASANPLGFYVEEIHWSQQK